MERGCSGTLFSVVPPVSPVAWSSFCTGVNPAKHGIFDFYEPQSGKAPGIRINNGSCRRRKAIWQLLNEAGLKTIVQNVPMTYPPDAVDGCLISGFDTPSGRSDFTYPPELKDELNRVLGGYVIEPDPSPKVRSDAQGYLADLKRTVQNRLAAARHLMTTRAWDFYMIVFMESDRAQHTFWKYIDPEHPLYEPAEARRNAGCMLAIYQALDAAVGELVDGVPEGTHIVIMSDHGADTVRRDINLNNWLADEGFLAFKRGRRSLIERFGDARKEALARMGTIRRRILKLRPEQAASRFFDAIDWPRTRAFFMGTWGKVFINTKARFPFGTVDEGRPYEQARDAIIERLQRLRDPATGKTVVKQILKREEIYQGPYSGEAPDLLIIWERGYHSALIRKTLRKGVRSYEPGHVFRPVRRMSGDHILEGLFVLVSPDGQQGRSGLEARITDVCPTILHLMGLPVPSYMDGCVLTAMLKPEFLQKHPVRSVLDSDGGALDAKEAGYTEGESGKVEKRLQDLGYL
jgi:predicted AlkP superfamily phosphohydrolase/phosphomutase